MATVTGKTSSKIDELLGPTIVGAELDAQGTLTFTKRNGSELNAGSLGPAVVGATINGAKHLIFTTMGGQSIDAGSVDLSDPLDSWPVGSVYIGVTSTNPATLLGGGTWVRFAKGKMLIGLDEDDPSLDAVEETGGTKSKQLTEANLPQHAHTINHDHPNTTISMQSTTNTTQTGEGIRVTDVQNLTGGSGTGRNITLNTPVFNGSSGPGAGNSTPFDVMNPYITTYMWKRTA